MNYLKTTVMLATLFCIHQIRAFKFTYIQGTVPVKLEVFKLGDNKPFWVKKWSRAQAESKSWNWSSINKQVFKGAADRDTVVEAKFTVDEKGVQPSFLNKFGASKRNFLPSLHLELEVAIGGEISFNTLDNKFSYKIWWPGVEEDEQPEAISIYINKQVSLAQQRNDKLKEAQKDVQNMLSALEIDIFNNDNQALERAINALPPTRFKRKLTTIVRKRKTGENQNADIELLYGMMMRTPLEKIKQLLASKDTETIKPGDLSKELQTKYKVLLDENKRYIEVLSQEVPKIDKKLDEKEIEFNKIKEKRKNVFSEIKKPSGI